MSFKLKYQSGAPVIVSLNVQSTVTKDTLVAIDGANNGIIPATSGTTELEALAVAQDTVSSGNARCILLEPAQIWEVDCTASTASTQVLNRHKLTDAANVDNTTCDYDASPSAVCLMLRTVGDAGDKKAEFQIISTRQVTA